MFSQDEDQDQRIVLSVVAGLLALVVLGVIAFAAMGGSADSTAKTAAVTPAVQPKPADATAQIPAITSNASSATLELKDDESKVIVENGVVKFYFASGKADLAAGANEALANVIKGIKAGQKATISGYHDSTGDPAKNAELAKKRTTSVRDAIVALGVPADALELKKPEQMEIKGNNAQARRVEVTLVK